MSCRFLGAISSSLPPWALPLLMNTNWSLASLPPPQLNLSIWPSPSWTPVVDHHGRFSQLCQVDQEVTQMKTSSRLRDLLPPIWLHGHNLDAAMGDNQIPPAWSERGYVPLEKVDMKDDQDEKGEAAYMRCFHASSKIGRVPNAAFFVNSPTARAYIAKRDKELFPVKEASGKPIPNPDMPSWTNRKESLENRLAPATSEDAQPNNMQATLSQKSMSTPSPRESQPQSLPPPSSTSSSADQPHLPWSIEPQTGATGPPRMLR